MLNRFRSVPIATALLLAGLSPALAAAVTTEAEAKTEIEGAGYAQVTQLHEVNAGEWMATATKDGRPVMVTVYPDGRVSLREHVDVPPPAPPPAPVKP